MSWHGWESRSYDEGWSHKWMVEVSVAWQSYLVSRVMERKMKGWVKWKAEESILVDNKRYLWYINMSVDLKVSQEDGILMKMDQYLFGKCNLMYFLILDNFVYRIQSLLWSAIWSYLHIYISTVYVGSRLNSYTYVPINTGTSHMISVNVVNGGMLRVITALWGALKKAILLCIYFERRSVSSVQVLHTLHLLPLALQDIQYEHQSGFSSSCLSCRR